MDFNDFNKALKRANSRSKDSSIEKYSNGVDYKKSLGDSEDESDDLWPRTPGSSDTGDPYDGILKPLNVPYWSKPPSTDEEKALYYGVHIHTETNPLGLHSHVPGGKMSGGHSHGPSNRFGVHHHKAQEIRNMTNVDGCHIHEGNNYPDGCHKHSPENFG